MLKGSPAYWQNELYDVLAMLRVLGTPTFMTLSAVDVQWPEMIQVVAAQCRQRLSQEDVLRMSMQKRQ